MSTLTRFVGIDEAGYGPNLGPLVMTAVVAEGTSSPDVWGDLPNVSRAGGPERCLWIDDSKAVFKARKGRDRLEAATWAAIDALGKPPDAEPSALLQALGEESLESSEWGAWIDPALPPKQPATNPHWSRHVGRSPLAASDWRIVEVRSSVVGPRRFNQGLARHASKATVHWEVFADLLRSTWRAGSTRVRADRHGGRTSYDGPLQSSFPSANIGAVRVTPERSEYLIEADGRTMTLAVTPRADAEDGLVALASLISKALRELWMDQFNHFWTTRIPGLKPSAGYPVDAARFRADIEETARRAHIDPVEWWRQR